MEFTAEQLSEVLQGTVEGNAQVVVNNISPIEEGTPQTLTFLSNPKYESFIYETKASIIVVNNDFIAQQPIPATLIRVPDAYKAFAQLMQMIQEYVQPKKEGVEPNCHIEKSAKIGDNTYVGAFAYVGKNVMIGKNCKIYPHVFLDDGVTIGDNTTLYSGVKVYYNCQIGNHCIVHGNAVIGSDGFGFAPDEQKRLQKIPQLGHVVIEDYVEIGANATIDRGALKATIIRKGAKLDNLVHLAHNVDVGENTALAAQVGIAGSTKIGKNNMFGGQVGVAGHVTVGDNNMFGAQAGVNRNVGDGEKLQGTPVMDIRTFQKSQVILRKLPDVYKKIMK